MIQRGVLHFRKSFLSWTFLVWQRQIGWPPARPVKIPGNEIAKFGIGTTDTTDRTCKGALDLFLDRFDAFSKQSRPVQFIRRAPTCGTEFIRCTSVLDVSDRSRLDTEDRKCKPAARAVFLQLQRERLQTFLTGRSAAVMDS